MLIKVCGMKIPSQIRELEQFADFVGFIFYEKSPRAVKKTHANKKSQKVGVFVNASEETILEKINTENLDIIQLHGSESPELCDVIQKKALVIKAFGVDKNFQFSILEDYKYCADYFLFDTKTDSHGGSGNQFNWQLLKKYSLDIPFFLSGGIDSNSVEQILEFSHPKMIGIDINSGFENSPGNKNIEQIKTFIDEIKSKHIYNS